MGPVIRISAAVLLLLLLLGVVPLAPSAANADGQEPGASSLVAERDTTVRVPPGREVDELFASCAGQPVRLELRIIDGVSGDFKNDQRVVGSVDLLLVDAGAELVIPVNDVPAQWAGFAVSAAVGDCVPFGETLLWTHDVGYLDETLEGIATGAIEIWSESLDAVLGSNEDHTPPLRNYLGTVTVTVDGIRCSTHDLGGSGAVKLLIGTDSDPEGCRKPEGRVVLYDQFGRPLLAQFELEPGVTWGLVNLAVDAFAATQVMPVETSRPQMDASGDSDSAPPAIPSSESDDSSGASDSWLRPALLAIGAAAAAVIGGGAMKRRRR